MITTRDQLIDALANNSSRIVLDKASLASQLAGRYCAMWRATGQPAQGAIPALAPELCTNETLGALQFTQQVAPATSYLGLLDVTGSVNSFTVEVHDRIAHNGGLVLNVTTPQPISGFDIDTLAPSAERVGDPSFGDLQWWAEVYTAGGATASNATFNVTFDDLSTGDLIPVAVGGTVRTGNRFSLDALRTTAQQGRNIKGVNSVTLSASTGTAGNFGITVTRPRAYIPVFVANLVSKMAWAELGLSEVPNGSCLEFMVLPSTTSSGTLRGGGKIAHG